MIRIATENNEAQTARFRQRLKQLQEDRRHWESRWTDIRDYLAPRRGRGLDSTNPRYEKTRAGEKKDGKIINGVGEDSLRVLAAGMQGGLTSPSRPWFTLAIQNHDLMEYGPVRTWLTDVRDRMLSVLGRSYFYAAVHNIYFELGAFGVGAMYMPEDFRTVINYRPFTLGEYWLALDHNNRPSMLYRKFAMTARQMTAQFGKDNVSATVREAVNSHSETLFDVVHAVEPRDNAIEDPLSGEYVSAYFENACDNENRLLGLGRHMGVPFVAPRWNVIGTDTYGESPGMMARGDVKQLQRMERDKLEALGKMVRPPMNGDPSLKKKGGTIVEGGVNYVDTTSGVGFSPAYQVRPDLQNIAVEIDRVENRIRRFFFNDLFLSIIQEDKNMTATEIVERHNEKMMMLGPVIENLQSEFLDRTIDRLYDRMDSFGMIPQPPRELEGVDLRVEYVSLLAQAQKMVGTESIQRTAEFVGGLAAINPEAVDKLNTDEAVDSYSMLVGAPPGMIRSDDDVRGIREQRRQAQALAQAIENTRNAAEGAKTLSEARTDDESLLSRVPGFGP